MEQTPRSCGLRSRLQSRGPCVRIWAGSHFQVHEPRQFHLSQVSAVRPKQVTFCSAAPRIPKTLGRDVQAVARPREKRPPTSWPSCPRCPIPHHPPFPLLLKFVSLRGMGTNVSSRFLQRKRASWKQCLFGKSMSLRAVWICLFYYCHILFQGFCWGVLEFF